MKTVRLAVLDVETTGFDPETCDITELAFIALEFDQVNKRCKKVGEFSSMANPGHTIPPEVSAVTHIIDEDVQDSPSSVDVVSAAMAEAKRLGVTAFVAHNAKFDQGFVDKHVPESERLPWVCTHRLARHLYDSPSYSNQTLRYLLKLDVPRDGAVHRASYDALVTGKLLVRIVQDVFDNVKADELVAAMQKQMNLPVVLKKMPFGKHAKQDFADIPLDYLQWASKQTFDDSDLLYTIQRELKLRAEKN